MGLDDSIPVVITGLDDCEEFKKSMWHAKAPLDTILVEKEILSVTKKLVSENPEIGAIILECSNLPPYAAAVQEATNLPVFDFITLINMVYNAVRRKRYVGFV